MELLLGLGADHGYVALTQTSSHGSKIVWESGVKRGLPPFVPWKLRAAGYEPFIQTVRGALRHAGGLRIDHVMGLFRLFWIPHGIDPAAGAYVRYPATSFSRCSTWKASGPKPTSSVKILEPWKKARARS
jgi:4-alpha-glucanotransferase